MRLLDRLAERVLLATIRTMTRGRFELESSSGVRAFAGARPGPAGALTVLNPRFFRRAVTGGETALGESYVDGDWTTPDLVSLLRLMLVNIDVLDRLPSSVRWLSRALEGRAHRRRDNTRTGSRRNIHEHYDLGNEFFRLFLDEQLLYSCAIYDRPDDALETAQLTKMRRICDKLALRPGDRVLEIGTGWGGFAVFAAREYGCHVTTTTISAEQHAHARAVIDAAGGVGERIELRADDYRDLRGQFNRIVSIEMFEAVGRAHYDEFFRVCHDRLTPDGAMLLQTITVDDARFAAHLREPGWISKYIFPGAELASVAEIVASTARVSSLRLAHTEEIGLHYARTLHQWRERFHDRIDDIRALGFDDRFIRMWDLYLAYCEAAFAEQHIGNAQLVLSKVPGHKVVVTSDLRPEPFEALALVHR